MVHFSRGLFGIASASEVMVLSYQILYKLLLAPVMRKGIEKEMLHRKGMKV